MSMASDGPDGVEERPEVAVDVISDAVTELRVCEQFDSFYRRELPALVALARSLSGSAYADDIAQEAMLAAFRRWDAVSRLDVPAAWVRRVCANRAVSVLRRRAVEGRGLLRLAQRDRGEPLDDGSAEFWTEVRRLPRRQAQVVALHYIYQLSVTEVAGTLGCAEGTVKSHLFRARATLAARLSEPTEGIS
jgi:RNA polymerase sigma-70 factor (ECF subfamily)